MDHSFPFSIREIVEDEADPAAFAEALGAAEFVNKPSSIVTGCTLDEMMGHIPGSVLRGEHTGSNAAGLTSAPHMKPLGHRLDHASNSIALSDNFPILFLVKDDADRIIRVSDKWLTWLGYERADVMGRRFQDLLAIATASEVQWPSREEPPPGLECKVLARDGRAVPACISTSAAGGPFCEANGIVIFFNPVRSDEAFQRLQMKSYRLQSCLDGTDAGTWEWNVQTGEARFNDRWAEIVGYRLEELGPISIDTWLNLAHPEDLEHSSKALERHWCGDIDFYDVEARMRHRDGHWVWVHDRGRVFTWTADGKPEWMFGTHFSLDEQRKRTRNAERMQRLLDRTGSVANVGGWELDLETDELLWTAETRRIHGVNDDYVPSVAKGIDFYAPEARTTIAEAVQEALKNGTPWDLELPFIRATGERIWVRAIGEVEFEDSEPKRVFGAFQDITARTARNAELLAARVAAEAAQERLWSAIECIPEAFVLYDAEDRLVMCNGKYRDLYHASPEKIRAGVTCENILPENRLNEQYPDAAGGEDESDADRLYGPKHVGKPIEKHLSDGRHLQVHQVKLPNGDTAGFEVDITELKNQKLDLDKKAKELAVSAITDPLTGLLNRRGLNDYIAANLELNSNKHFGVIHVDIDRFKPINDVYGHDAGDSVLVKVANILRKDIRLVDCVARVGGDEFVLILSAPCTARRAQSLAKRIIKRCSRSITWHNNRLRFGASIGIAFGAGSDLALLMRDADIALYEAKRNGRNCYHIFNGQLREKVRLKKLLCDELLEGIEREEIVAYYQPQLCARSGELVAIEALARWNHPTRGVLLPDAFLNIAEELGLLPELDARVFHHGFETGKALLASGVDFTRLSFNMSLAKLTSPDALAWLPKVDNLPFELSLEVLETLDLDQNFNEIAWIFEHLRARGIGIEIDDFGTGRASLTSLLRVKPDRIKIDGQITRAAVQSNTSASAMVKAVSEMCRGLGIPMTAEGIETEEQAVQMRGFGCELLQGFYLCPPLSREDLLVWSRRLSEDHGHKSLRK
jgi:diguanylate cyclase (GGDEF)-like protein/PAS domain S-box-containing protein